MNTNRRRNGFGRAMIWKLAIAALLCACNMSAVNPPTAPAPIAATPAVHAERGAKSTYEVGVGFALKTPNDVPWESLKAGDTVLIHWRPEAYKSKWVICAAGTEQAPITIRGVPGPKGQLPVIDGEDATTRKQISYWGENRSVVKIGGAKIPEGLGSKWIVIENLDIANGHPPMGYTSCKGEAGKYSRNAAGIWVENCEHLVVRYCNLHNCGNGFVSSSNDGRTSDDILVEGCHIFDNGNVGSGYEHNIYTESKGITFQYNWLGPLRRGCPGNNLKDRSSACVIRYNWMDGGDKVLDLVDAEDSKLVRADPRYRQTFVYGNVIIKRGGGHAQVVHYGGDGAKASTYRKGTLYFYNNTVVSKKQDGTQLFWISSNDETVDARNNIFFTDTPGKSLALMRFGFGVLELSHNYFKPGFRKVAEAPNAIVQDDKTSVMAAAPGFVDEAGQDFHLQAGSPCKGAGTKLAPAALPLEREYKKHQGSAAKSSDSKSNVGAY